MKPLGAARAHFWLLQTMLKRTGCDAVAAFDQGTLTSETWSDMLTRCRGCDQPAACQRLLARGLADAAPQTAPPVFCENRSAFSQLPNRKDEGEI